MRHAGFGFPAFRDIACNEQELGGSERDQADVKPMLMVCEGKLAFEAGGGLGLVGRLQRLLEGIDTGWKENILDPGALNGLQKARREKMARLVIQDRALRIYDQVEI
jgi:hypothetical protein